MSSAAAAPPNRLTEILLLVILAALWGTGYSFIKIAVATIPPLTLTAGRTLIAGLILLAVMRMRGLEWPTDRAIWRRLYFQGCLNAVVPFTLVSWAERTVDASLATILNSTTPILAFLFTVAITRHERVSGRQVVGVAAGMAGVCLIIGPEALEGLGRELMAQLALILAAACYGAAVIFGRRLADDPTVSAAGTMLSAATVLVPLSLIVDRPWMLSPTADSLAAMLALAVFSTAIAYMIYFRLIHTLGSVGTTAQAYVRVPIGVAVGVLWLGEMLSPTVWAGLICVVAGVAAMTFPKRSAAPVLAG